MNCKVKNCRFSSTHDTINHQCGSCKRFGHGRLECGNQQMIDNLKQYFTSVVNCNLCDSQNSHTKFCPNNGFAIIDDKLDLNGLSQSNISRLQSGQYYEVYQGMGCNTYVRKNLITGNLESLFMHTDAWGQYGIDTSDLPRYRAFINGYTKISL